ncbi:hypothetical protein TNCV_401781 [Trichonephila clavipes]|nr:hypothetical protein TNCV_401781 [Trichonephila clavipes]
MLRELCQLFYVVVVSNPLGSGKTTRPFEISGKECNKPDLALQKTVPRIGPSSPKDEQGLTEKDFTLSQRLGQAVHSF